MHPPSALPILLPLAISSPVYVTIDKHLKTSILKVSCREIHRHMFTISAVPETTGECQQAIRAAKRSAQSEVLDDHEYPYLQCS